MEYSLDTHNKGFAERTGSALRPFLGCERRSLGERRRPPGVYMYVALCSTLGACAVFALFVTRLLLLHLAVPDGTEWSQPSYPYAAKCLRWLREDYASLDSAERAVVDDAIKGSGVEMLLGEISGWPNPGMGSAVCSDSWAPTMGEAKL